MSALGHIAIGAATARRVTPSEAPSGILRNRMLALSALALLPDLDFLLPAGAFPVGPFTHRGASHSLAVAVVVGLAVANMVTIRRGSHAIGWGLIATAVVASHGIMDAFGATNLGVALLWPFSTARILAPWHVLPNPLWGGVLSSAFLVELGIEAALFLPFWLYAFWPRRADVRKAA